MSSIKIVIGSKSPRRQALVKELGLPVELRTKEVEEIYPEELHYSAVPEYLAELKAQPLIEGLSDKELLITSDTVVIHNDKIIGKPQNRDMALSLLQELSNSTHKVITGVYIQLHGKSYSFSNETDVVFNKLTPEEIMHYIDTFQPYDKAGSYGIQEWIGYIGVKEIRGCYYNVMGLPVSAIYQVLKQEFNISAINSSD
jgi:septum formation protein